jgi:hypothetical protein
MKKNELTIERIRKAEAVIDSCVNCDQLKGAIKYIDLFIDRHDVSIVNDTLIERLKLKDWAIHCNMMI